MLKTLLFNPLPNLDSRTYKSLPINQKFPLILEDQKPNNNPKLKKNTSCQSKINDMYFFLRIMKKRIRDGPNKLQQYSKIFQEQISAATAFYWLINFKCQHLISQLISFIQQNIESMIGGFGNASHEVTQEHKDLVKNNLAKINAKLGTHATSFTINSVTTQVVAGTNYFFHLTSNDGQKYSALIYVPLPHTNAPAEVTKAEIGHTAAKQ